MASRGSRSSRPCRRTHSSEPNLFSSPRGRRTGPARKKGSAFNSKPKSTKKPKSTSLSVRPQNSRAPRNFLSLLRPVVHRCVQGVPELPSFRASRRRDVETRRVVSSESQTPFLQSPVTLQFTAASLPQGTPHDCRNWPTVSSPGPPKHPDEP